MYVFPLLFSRISPFLRHLLPGCLSWTYWQLLFYALQWWWFVNVFHLTMPNSRNKTKYGAAQRKTTQNHTYAAHTLRPSTVCSHNQSSLRIHQPSRSRFTHFNSCGWLTSALFSPGCSFSCFIRNMFQPSKMCLNYKPPISHHFSSLRQAKSPNKYGNSRITIILQVTLTFWTRSGWTV